MIKDNPTSTKASMDKRVSKYMLYAIGEIILVVIGILIALQINNWNESRNLQKKVTSIYAIVKSDLQLDIENIDHVFERMLPQDTLLKMILEGDMTREVYDNCEKCQFVVGGFPDITLRSRGLSLLEENSTIFDAQRDSLFIQISEFYSYHFTEIKVDMEEIELDYTDNFKFWKTNKSWFADNVYSIQNDEFVRYALEDSDYINRVASWRKLYFENYLGHLKEYKENALILIADLDKRTE